MDAVVKVGWLNEGGGLRGQHRSGIGAVAVVIFLPLRTPLNL